MNRAALAFCALGTLFAATGCGGEQKDSTPEPESDVNIADRCSKNPASARILDGVFNSAESSRSIGPCYYPYSASCINVEPTPTLTRICTGLSTRCIQTIGGRADTATQCALLENPLEKIDFVCDPVIRECASLSPADANKDTHDLCMTVVKACAEARLKTSKTPEAAPPPWLPLS